MKPKAKGQPPRGREDVILRQLDDEWVIFDPVKDRLHALNLTAALVWTHCTGELAVQEIADAVGGSFEPPVPAADVEPDVVAALDRFRTEGLLT